MHCHLVMLLHRDCFFAKLQYRRHIYPAPKKKCITFARALASTRKMFTRQTVSPSTSIFNLFPCTFALAQHALSPQLSAQFINLLLLLLLLPPREHFEKQQFISRQSSQTAIASREGEGRNNGKMIVVAVVAAQSVTDFFIFTLQLKGKKIFSDTTQLIPIVSFWQCARGSN